ncbi:type II toxin-antitoxin system prevent-host-death family antitoxin [Marinococcus sp. PL1-022]|uniref:type II toxin-antitoxin system Phd/YefM family antitoxin n=1 Tax=Marinococcus sp. PL1-022 TaxID=3095363 RepID=UPI0029C4C1EA|nr:type II toxin-antitoxin system prevent-host-death family antitoxin [Marinococcus sp. PL1-022]MDX6153097.1 type II toxin-antitoxin system prevent-host-death family antitoxin [Marinococcus sp. PL1-022]
MTVMNYSNARKNFKGLIDKVNDDQEAVTITTKERNAVLISEDEYNQYLETIYLLNNPSNAKHLSESIHQLKQEETTTVDIDE